jgi:hypothetical protein
METHPLALKRLIRGAPGFERAPKEGEERDSIFQQAYRERFSEVSVIEMIDARIAESGCSNKPNLRLT